jgi:hypothetical protein
VISSDNRKNSTSTTTAHKSSKPTMTSVSPLSPTFYGHIASTQDALLLFEACLSGTINQVARRPHDRERASLIKSGNVFIYEEHSSGIKRWTDGVAWSPSRILGNFLVYRELERPFPPGEKKRAMKRSKRSPGVNKAPAPYGGLSNGATNGYNAASATASKFDSANSSLSKETERSLVGSLVDSYEFKEEGLVKKTVSVTVGGVSHHLVSYYTVADVMNNKFSTPTKDSRFQHVTPRHDLITKQNFRSPIDEIDNLDRIDDGSVYGAYPYPRNDHEMANQSISHRPMTLPTPQTTYPQTSSLFDHYMVRENHAYGDGANNGYNTQFDSVSAIYPAPRTGNLDVGGHLQQRYNSTIAISSDSSGARMLLVSTSFPHRPSNFEQGGSVDSGISQMFKAHQHPPTRESSGIFLYGCGQHNFDGESGEGRGAGGMGNDVRGFSFNDPFECVS